MNTLKLVLILVLQSCTIVEPFIVLMISFIGLFFNADSPDSDSYFDCESGGEEKGELIANHTIILQFILIQNNEHTRCSCKLAATCNHSNFHCPFSMNEVEILLYISYVIQYYVYIVITTCILETVTIHIFAEYCIKRNVCLQYCMSCISYPHVSSKCSIFVCYMQILIMTLHSAYHLVVSIASYVVYYIIALDISPNSIHYT